MMPLLDIQTVDNDSLKFIKQFCKDSTDLEQLSRTDLELLALSYYLHKTTNSFQIPRRKSRKQRKESEKIEGFFSGVENDSDQAWISPKSLELESNRDKNSYDDNSAKNKENFEVALMTSDFDMQNVALKLNMNILSHDNRIITKTKFFVTICCYCGLEVKKPDGKVFCPHCGHKGLKKIGASIEKNGSRRLHIAKNYEISKRAFRETTEEFKGGKHPNLGPLSYGHRVAKEKLPKKVLKARANVWDPEFGFDGDLFPQRDLNSKAAKLNIRMR